MSYRCQFHFRVLFSGFRGLFRE